MAAAKAGALFKFGSRGPAQRVVAPFAGYAIDAREQLAVHAYACAAAGAQYGGEYGVVVTPCSVCGFGKGQAVGVVGQGYRPLQQVAQVLLHGLAVQPGGVGVLDAAGYAGNAAGNAHAHGDAGAAGVAFSLLHQGVDGLQGGLVVASGGGYPFAEVFVGLVIQQDDLCLGAAQVYAYQPVLHGGCFSRCFLRYRSGGWYGIPPYTSLPISAPSGTSEGS